VADDREQIIANFEDGDGQHHAGGDGASGSSVGTGSPDIFQVCIWCLVRRVRKIVKSDC
jgi:hypothetical protein